MNSEPKEKLNSKIDFIKQGFLCPICKIELDNENELLSHYSLKHSENKSSNVENSNTNPVNLSKNLNKFFDKAKKILKTDFKKEENEIICDNKVIIEENLNQNKLSESEYYFSLRKDQTIGFSIDHFDQKFKSIRNSKIERDIFETNKLMIRLDKLLENLPVDVEKRKAHEMSIVSWVNDEDVKLCPFCAKSFNISRRRHHCRLCGAIMCDNCSLFLEVSYAKKLITPVDLDASFSNNTLTVKESSLSNLNVSKTSNKRSSTHSLLVLGMNLANMNKESNDYQVKTCKECKILLDRRMKQITDHHTTPILKTYYDKLKDLQLESDKLIPLYVQMCTSLRKGETLYQLQDAQLLRIKLMKLGDAIDNLSKKILADSSEDNDYVSLKNKLRLFVAQYLQKNLLGLPSLPRDYELKELQEKKHNEIKLALEKGEQILEDDSFNIKKQNESINSNECGWNIQSINLNESQEEDPILLQIKLIKGYIDQARQDHKYEEVSILKNNLNQLEIEYFLQENEKQIDFLNL